MLGGEASIKSDGKERSEGDFVELGEQEDFISVHCRIIIKEYG